MAFAETATGAVALRPPRAGTYVTDGEKLLRIESELITIEGEALVELEDCMTLDRWVWPLALLESRHMRPVEPAAS